MSTQGSNMEIITNDVPIALHESEVMERFASKVDPNSDWPNSDHEAVLALADTFQELYREKAN